MNRILDAQTELPNLAQFEDLYTHLGGGERAGFALGMVVASSVLAANSSMSFQLTAAQGGMPLPLRTMLAIAQEHADGLRFAIEHAPAQPAHRSSFALRNMYQYMLTNARNALAVITAGNETLRIAADVQDEKYKQLGPALAKAWLEITSSASVVEEDGNK